MFKRKERIAMNERLETALDVDIEAGGRDNSNLEFSEFVNTAPENAFLDCLKPKKSEKVKIFEMVNDASKEEEKYIKEKQGGKQGNVFHGMKVVSVVLCSGIVLALFICFCMLIGRICAG